jgi:predicted naringenin-chalcone synthase
MTWKCEDWGFRMTMLKEIPVLIRRNFPRFLETLAKKAHLCTEEAQDSAYFAIHPGGPKIIDQISELLQLRESQCAHSREILRNYGNMSSATLPHVWDLMLKDSSIPKGAVVISVAFGPGFSLSGAVFQKG